MVWALLPALLSVVVLLRVGSRSLTVNLRTGFRPFAARHAEPVHLRVWAHQGPAAWVGQARRFKLAFLASLCTESAPGFLQPRRVDIRLLKSAGAIQHIWTTRVGCTPGFSAPLRLATVDGLY